MSVELADANEFRHALRRERLARGLSQDALGATVHLSASQIGNYEAGRQLPPKDIAAALDTVLEAGSELLKLAEDARGEAVAPWLRPWREHEERATLLRWFEHSLVPGLLQTEAYARAVISAGPHTRDQVEEAVGIRMARQTATLERPEPVVLSAVIGEPALRHGDPALMKEQLEHLVDIGHRPNVHLRVIPVSVGLHTGLTGAFILATLGNGGTVAYQDGLIEATIVSGARDLHRVATAWEAVSGHALPCEMSRQLILKVIDDYDERAHLAQEHPQR